MPTIPIFYGIIIRMYFGPKEHNPPHIHAYYQNYTATFDIENNVLLKGDIPPKQLKLIQAWIEINKEDLFANWSLCQNGETPHQIKPLS